jgi:hypothetical protein
VSADEIVGSRKSIEVADATAMMASAERGDRVGLRHAGPTGAAQDLEAQGALDGGH